MYESGGRFLGALVLAAGLVLSSWLVMRSLERIKGEHTIQVTGSAKRRIRSDLILWSASVSTRSAELGPAFRQLSAAIPKVASYLEQKGIPRGQMVISSVVTQTIHPQDREGHPREEVVSGYVLHQSVEVRSHDVDKVGQISREATELIHEGIPLESSAPQYHYTKLGDLKIHMLAEAARDARVRANEIAVSTGARIGPLRSARMGVIQINPADSTDVSSEGNNDTSSVEKDILSVVSATFALE